MTKAYIIILNMVKEPCNTCYLNHLLSMLREPLICMLNLTHVIHVQKMYKQINDKLPLVYQYRHVFYM